jgi:hypothetical protein
VEAVNHLKVRSCLIDGEAVCCDEKGLAVFHVLRRRWNEPQAFLYAFDLLELDGTDLRRESIEVRRATLASILPLQRPPCRRQPATGEVSRADADGGIQKVGDRTLAADGIDATATRRNSHLLPVDRALSQCLGIGSGGMFMIDIQGYARREGMADGVWSLRPSSA